MVAQTAKEMGLEHVVITSVTRDDLPDKGASGFVSTMRAIRDLTRHVPSKSSPRISPGVRNCSR
jgi:lipoic acid synthetase